MDRLVIIILIAVLVIGAAAAGTLWRVRHQRRQARPEAAAEQVKSMPHPLPNVEIIGAAWADGRIVAQTQYFGSASEAPKSSAEWHQLAQSCAWRIYEELGQKYAVEAQLFHNGEFRAVSVAGI